MGHADDSLPNASIGSAVEQFVENDNGGLRSFERKALVANKTRMQEMFEFLSLDQLFESADFAVRAASGWHRLHVLLEPVLLLRNLDVHVLAADFAGVGSAQRLENLAQCRDAMVAVNSEAAS